MKKINVQQDNNQAVELNLIDLIYPAFKSRTDNDQKITLNLCTNISQVGLINPVVTRKAGDKWEIICGVKRVQAFTQLGKQSIPAFVIENIDDKQALILSISDNLNRENLNAFDQVYSLLHLLSLSLNISEEDVKTILKRIDNFDKGRVKELALEEQDAEKVIIDVLAKFGRIKINSFIEKMRVLNLNPIIIDAIRNKGLHFSYGIEINKVSDDNKVANLISQVIDNNLSIKELTAKVKQILGVSDKPNPFQGIVKKAREFYNLTEDKQHIIQQKLQEIQNLLSA